MWKEVMICVVIVTAIIIGNSITQDYTKKTVKKICTDLSNLKKELDKSNENEDVSQNATISVNIIKEDWERSHDRLAYYIEHNELEKVEDNFTSMQSFMENKKYVDAINQLDKSIFILNHIQEKYAINLENVF